MKRGFLDKLIERIRLVPSHEVGQYLQELAHEKGFLEAIFNALLEGVIVTDPQGIVIYLNPKACNFFGLTGLQLIGKQLAEAVPGLSLEMTKGTEIVSRDLEVFYPEHRFLNFYITPLMSETNGTENSSLVGRAIILRDITANQQQTAEALECERSSIATLLAAGVAHEIGNPLNSLAIHLHLLQRQLDQLPAPQRQEFEKSLFIANQEVTRLDQILTQFLQAVRPAPLQLNREDFNNIITEVLSFLDQEIKNRHIHLDLALQKNIPLLSLDHNQLKQALYNIIRNSFQAMSGGGLLYIRTGYDETHVWVSVGDTGGGIPAANFEKIFEPYFTTKSDGNGLGLHVVQRIVRAHGGEIVLKSTEGKGLIFTIRLPRDDRPVRFLPEK